MLRQLYTIADILVIVSLALAPFVAQNLAFLRVLRALRLVHSYHVLRDLRRVFADRGRVSEGPDQAGMEVVPEGADVGAAPYSFFVGVLTVAYGVPLPEATAIALLDRVISVFSVISSSRRPGSIPKRQRGPNCPIDQLGYGAA